MAKWATDRQFAKRVESGQCPTDEAIVAAYVRCCPTDEAAKLLGVSEERLRRWTAAGYTRDKSQAIRAVRQAREEYETMRRLERGREVHQRRRQRIAELEAEIEVGIGKQQQAHQKLMGFASLCRSELSSAIEEARGTAPKKAIRARKRILRKCEEYGESCARAHVDMEPYKEKSRA